MHSTHTLALTLLMSGSFLLGTSSQPAAEVAPAQPAAAIATTSTAKAVKGGTVIKLESRAQFDELINSGAVVVVDIYAEWCGPCKQFAPTFEKVAATLTDVIFIKVNGDDFAELVK